jgi:hypothetical protein
MRKLRRTEEPIWDFGLWDLRFSTAEVRVR